MQPWVSDQIYQGVITRTNSSPTLYELTNIGSKHRALSIEVTY